MLVKVQLPWNVVISAENLQLESLMLKRLITVRLMSEIAKRKVHKDLGYFQALTSLEKIGEAKVREHTGDVFLPVVFNATFFRIYRGEVLEGVVHKVLKHSGPIQNVYLSNVKMPDYHYVPGEKPFFMNAKNSEIKKDFVVRFVVIGTRWIEEDSEFRALGSLEGDDLGPISSVDI